MGIMKTCSKCKQVKSLDDFYKLKRAKDGLQSECKDCHKKWMLENPERYRLIKKKHQNKDATKIMNNNRSALYYKNNKEKARASCENWRKNNIERVRAQARLRRRNRNPQRRLSDAISCGIRDALKGNKNRKHWEDLVGYIANQLRQHLEQKFTDGMTWENYGKWHVDHIIPQSSFVYNSPNDVEFKMCWRLENLQPLWAKDNKTKSNKLSPSRVA